jgi:hypothetical protein
VSQRNELVANLRLFIDEAVLFEDPSLAGAAELAHKLDVLERAVELLRLEHGEMQNRLRMEDCLARGLEVSRGADGALRLRVGGSATGIASPGWPSPGGRTQDELQIPLILYLFITYRHRRRINDLLVSFLEEMRPWLSPDDVESTRTGVMRAMTTTRTAARALRLHGLIIDSPETAYKSWELSILGLLMASILVERSGRFVEMAPRGVKASASGRFGASNHLASALAALMRELNDPMVVSQALSRVCIPNRDVFATFDEVAAVLAQFAADFGQAESGRKFEWRELRERARALLTLLGEKVPASALADDMAKDLALRDLLQTNQ